jgi:uncharacterized protein (TIGR02145 family)
MNIILYIRIYQLFLLGLLFILTGCCKDSVEIPSSLDLLTSTWWRLVQVDNMTIPEEQYWIFRTDGNYYVDNGNHGPWSLEDGGKTLKLPGPWGPLAYTITTLTETTLKYKYKYVDGGYMSFTALSGAKLTTIGASSLTRNSVVLHGVVRTNKSPAESVIFEYGTSLSYGQEVIPSISNISALTLTDNIDASISGINLETTYHYRIKAISGTETFYGQDLTFKTFNTEQLSDINGNKYNTVTIGTQTWMAENLRVNKYNNTSPIPYVADNLKWASMTSSAYCWYNNDSLSYKNKYGAIYNWYVVNTGKLCPIEWHVPSEKDWLLLIQYLDPNSGAKLSEYGTNSTGFSAKGAGFRWNDNGTFGPDGICFLWTSTEDNNSNVFRYAIDGSSITKYPSTKVSGFSVRCLKD